MFFALVRQRTTNGRWQAGAALLFAVHPIPIEAVSWISAVPEILFSLAGMGAIYSSVRFRQEPKSFGYHLALGGTLKYEGNLTEAKSQLELGLAWPRPNKHRAF